MSRIIAFDHVSADGYFATPDGRLDWTTPEPALDADATDGSHQADTMLFGRKTYQMFESFWPHALADATTAPDPHTPGRRSEAMRAMAQWINDSRKIVYSTTLKRVTWNASRIVPRFDPDEIAALKRESSKDIMVFGSGSIVSLLTQHKLVDEYHLIVNPTLLGQGRSLITDVARRTPLALIEATPYPSGVVRLKYKST